MTVTFTKAITINGYREREARQSAEAGGHKLLLREMRQGPDDDWPWRIYQRHYGRRWLGEPPWAVLEAPLLYGVTLAEAKKVASAALSSVVRVEDWGEIVFDFARTRELSGLSLVEAPALRVAWAACWEVAR